MTLPDEARAYRAVQRRNFGRLVRAGSYGPDFDHKPAARAFVKSCFDDIRRVVARPRLRLLDCGCGPGAWLDFIRRELDAERGASCRYYGFDLTPEMIEVARQRLPALPAGRLRQGDVTAEESYTFDGEEPLFDIIFCYDVVQQLPPELQFPACETMARHLRDGGVALIFDQDRHSAFGRGMACAKLVTRSLGIPLVPPHYTAARYPPLKRFARRLAARNYRTALKIAPNKRKRALLVRRASAAHSGFEQV